MTRTFFTADHHFGHAGILSPRMDAPRPFASVEEHDRTLVECWNAVVRKDDVVHHLGDFSYRANADHALRIFRRLNGRKFLVRGNHDKVGASLPWDGPVQDVARVHVHDPGMRSAVGVWLSHYAHRAWPHQHRGDLHLFGHSHGSLPAIRNSLDVGVDCWGWTPVTLPQVMARLEELGLAGDGS